MKTTEPSLASRGVADRNVITRVVRSVASTFARRVASRRVRIFSERAVRMTPRHRRSARRIRAWAPRRRTDRSGSRRRPRRAHLRPLQRRRVAHHHARVRKIRHLSVFRGVSGLKRAPRRRVYAPPPGDRPAALRRLHLLIPARPGGDVHGGARLHVSIERHRRAVHRHFIVHGVIALVIVHVSEEGDVDAVPIQQLLHASGLLFFLSVDRRSSFSLLRNRDFRRRAPRGGVRVAIARGHHPETRGFLFPPAPSAKLGVVSRGRSVGVVDSDAIHRSMGVKDDPRGHFSIGVRRAEIVVEPRAHAIDVRGVEILRPEESLGVVRDDVRGAEVERVVVVLGSNPLARGRESRAVMRKIVRAFVVTGAHHVRHARGDGFDVAHPSVAVSSVGRVEVVREVAAMQHRVGKVGFDLGGDGGEHGGGVEVAGVAQRDERQGWSGGDLRAGALGAELETRAPSRARVVARRRIGSGSGSESEYCAAETGGESIVSGLPSPTR